MRLIDADFLLKKGWVLHKMVGTTLHEMPLNHPDVPTVDAEPIRHGRWVKPNPKGIVTYDEHAYAECSVCHTAEYLGYGMRYCPTCGAKMDGGE